MYLKKNWGASDYLGDLAPPTNRAYIQKPTSEILPKEDNSNIN